MPTIADSVRMALTKANKKQKDLAEYLGKSKQSMSMKFTNDTFFGDDLVTIAKFTGGKLAFVYPDGTTINIDVDLDMSKKRNQKKAPDAATSEAGE